MDVEKALQSRRSVRKYSGESIEECALEKILLAGLHAPSGRNLRPVEFIVVRDKQTLEKLSGAKTAGSQFVREAAAAVVVLGDTEKTDTWIEDGSAALMAMMLQATELGIGACWVQIRGRESSLMQETAEGTKAVAADTIVHGILSVPEKYAVLALLSLGKPAQASKERALDDCEKKRIHREQY